eukprot:scaffold19421_cov30-Prasinocladus_malaysianus.AAC.1
MGREFRPITRHCSCRPQTSTDDSLSGTLASNDGNLIGGAASAPPHADTVNHNVILSNGSADGLQSYEDSAAHLLEGPLPPRHISEDLAEIVVTLNFIN